MTNISLISENDNSTVLAEYTGLNRVATSFQSEDALEKELIKTLIEQGYERLNINSEDELILNLRRQLEKLNNYHFNDGEWDYFFTKVIANKNDYIIEKTRLIQEDYKQELTLDSGEKRNIYLIDKNNIHNNSVQVLNQYEVDELIDILYGVIKYLYIMPKKIEKMKKTLDEKNKVNKNE